MQEHFHAAGVEPPVILALQRAGSVARLAEITGVSERTVYAWKNGERHPSRSNIAKMTRYLEIVAPPYEVPPGGQRPLREQRMSFPFPAHPVGGASGLEAHDSPGRYAVEKAAGHESLRAVSCVAGGLLVPGEAAMAAGGDGAPFLVLPFFSTPFLRGTPVDGEISPAGGGCAFSAAWIEAKGLRPQALRLMRMTGRGMEDTLHDGDLCLVNTDDETLTDDRVYLVRYGADFFVRRLFRMPGGHLFRNDNRALSHQDFELSPAPSPHWEVLGRLVWAGKCL